MQINAIKTVLTAFIEDNRYPSNKKLKSFCTAFKTDINAICDNPEHIIMFEKLHSREYGISGTVDFQAWNDDVFLFGNIYFNREGVVSDTYSVENLATARLLIGSDATAMKRIESAIFVVNTESLFCYMFQPCRYKVEDAIQRILKLKKRRK